MTRRLLSNSALFGVIAAALSAGCAAPQAHERDIDAQADPIFKQMCNALDGAKAIRFHVRATMDRPVETGQLAQFHRTSDVTLFRPDRLFAKTDSDDGQWTVWYRGKSLTVLDRDENMYATETVPARTDEMLDYMADEYHVIVPMADLMVGKTYDSLLTDVWSGTYVGLHNVGDTPCHHLLFRQDNLDWQIWIDSGKQPLPRKMVITYTEEPGQPQYVALIDDWDLAPTVSDETFTFKPPAEAKAVSMADLVAEAAEEREEAEAGE
jgi:hypothetical protein